MTVFASQGLAFLRKCAGPFSGCLGGYPQASKVDVGCAFAGVSAACDHQVLERAAASVTKSAYIRVLRQLLKARSQHLARPDI